MKTKFSLRQIFENPTILGLVESTQNLLSQELEIKESLPVEIKKIREGNEELPLYFIHVAQEPFTLPIANLLHKKYSLYSISSLGELITRKMQDHDLNISVEKLASIYINALLKFQPSGPYYFLGVSFGGIIAYEMAIQLLEKGYKVNNVIMFDTPDPFNRNILNIKMISLLGYFKKLIRQGPYYIIDRLQKKSLDKLSRKKQELIQDYNLKKIDIKKRVEMAEKNIVYQILKLSTQMRRNYNPQKYQGKVTLFFADDEMFSFQKKWKDLTDNKLNIIPIPGRHITMFKEPNIKTLVENLEKLIEKDSNEC